MHQGLRLGGAGVEDGAGGPEELEEEGVVRGDAADPGDEAGVEVEPFHRVVLLHADRQAVERADRLAVLGEVLVQPFGPG